jgi:hypothetical protein
MIAKVPEALRKDASVYADEGTALHDVVMRLLANPKLTPVTFIGKTIAVENRTLITITAAHVADCVLPILEFFNSEIADIDDYWLEMRVDFPGVDAAYGTCDFFGLGATRSVLVDWKMGAGVGVTATVPDVDDPAFETVNPQILFYLCGLVARFPEALANGRTLDAYIVQPRHQDSAKRVTVARNITRDELDRFNARVKAAVAEARGPSPRPQRGDWCRFAPCKVVCPLWTGPLLELSTFTPPTRDVPDYGELLAAGLALVQLIEPMISEFKNQAHNFLESGGAVPGWKLVPKRAMRRWADETAALAALAKAGFNTSDIVTLKSVAQVEKVAKAARIAIPKSIGIASISSGSTLAKEDDPRPEMPGPDAVINSFRRAIASLEDLSNG